MAHSDQAGTGTAAEIVAWLVQTLRFVGKPIPRDQLAVQLQAWVFEAFACQWSGSTASRRLREAIRAATDAGWPIVSEGEGFFLARTSEQRRLAAARLRRTADDLNRRAAALEIAPVSGEQVGMFGEAR